MDFYHDVQHGKPRNCANLFHKVFEFADDASLYLGEMDCELGPDEPATFLVGVEDGGPHGMINNVVFFDASGGRVSLLLYRDRDDLPEETEDADWQCDIEITSPDGLEEAKGAIRQLAVNIRG